MTTPLQIHFQKAAADASRSRDLEVMAQPARLDARVNIGCTFAPAFGQEQIRNVRVLRVHAYGQNDTGEYVRKLAQLKSLVHAYEQ